MGRVHLVHLSVGELYFFSIFLNYKQSLATASWKNMGKVDSIQYDTSRLLTTTWV